MTSPRPNLTPAQLAELRRHGNIRPALYLGGVLAAIAGTFALLARVPHPAVWVPCCLIMGALQHHLTIIQDEAIAYMLLRSRRLNDLAGDLAACLVFLTARGRWAHWQRQRQSIEGVSQDQQYERYPPGRAYLAGDAALHLSGLAALWRLVRQALSPGTLVRRPRPGGAGGPLNPHWHHVAAVQLGLLGALALLSRWEHYVWLWIVPLLTVAATLAHFRRVAAHARPRHPGGGGSPASLRTILCSPLEAFFFAPMNVNYRAEQQLCGGVPYHRLPRCHTLLSSQPGYGQAVDVQRGYLRFLLRR